jgi:hypothetical protein
MEEKNELMTTTAPPLIDGIDGHTDVVAGEETKQSKLFRGTRIKFGKTSEWETKDDVIDPKARFILIDIARITTKWGHDRKPAETIVLKPHEPFPDVTLWNDKLPHTEWIQGFNGLQGPWRNQQVVYFSRPSEHG